MSRFDMLGSWMQGAQLGQQQYAQLAAMAQQDAAMRQRQAEEEAQRAYQQQALQQAQGQFDARHALDLQQFGQQQTMQNAQLDRWNQDRAWQEQDRAQEEAIRQQEQQYLQHAREWAKQRVRAALPSGGAQPMRDSYLPPEAMDVGPMQGWGPGPGVPGAAAVPPETDAMLRMIDHADGNSLKQLLPYLDKQEDHRKIGLLIQGVENGGYGNMLQDPVQRAIYTAAKAAKDPERQWAAFSADYAMQNRRAEMEAKQAHAIELAKVRASLATNRGALTQSRAMVQTMKQQLDQREQEYRAHTAAKTAKEGPLVPPTAQDIEYAKKDPNDAYEDRIWPGVSKGAITKAKAKVDAWNLYEKANQDYTAAVSRLQQDAEPAMQDAGQQDAAPNEEQIWNRVLEEFQSRNGRAPNQGDADALRQIEQDLTGG